MRRFTPFLIGLAAFAPMIASAQDLIVPIGSRTTIPNNPAAYFVDIYRWSIGLASLLALAMIVFGAVEYTASAGNIGSKDRAKTRIQSAIFGLVLLLGSATILLTINDDFQGIQSTGLQNSVRTGNFSRAGLQQVQSENIDDFETATAGMVAPTDYNDVVDILSFRDAGEDHPQDEIDALRDVNENAFQRYTGARNAAIQALERDGGIRVSDGAGGSKLITSVDEINEVPQVRVEHLQLTAMIAAQREQLSNQQFSEATENVPAEDLLLSTGLEYEFD